MQSSLWTTLLGIGLIGCAVDDAADVMAVGSDNQAVLWSDCTPAANCPPQENCWTTADGGEYGSCYQLCDDNGHNCTSPEQCSASAPYCCQNVFCNAGNDYNDRFYYIAGIAPGCHTGVSCQACPANKERNKSNPGDPNCCTPTYSCTGKVCGDVLDSCGWLTTGSVCGTCSVGTCSNDGTCCKLSQAAACGDKHCGTVPDGCGGTYSCGSCGANQFCGTGGYCYCSYPYRNCGEPLPARPQCYMICP